MIVEKDEIKRITDFKTGDIFENTKAGKKIKEVYRCQLALYASIILKKQSSLPVLSIENIRGDKHIVELSKTFISDVKYRSVELKRKIDFAVNNDDINSLAVSNCEYCNYRIVCQSYKNNLMNKKIGSRIDLHGKVVKVNIAEIQIEIVNRIFIVKKIATDKKIKIGSEISIYNLYYPDEEKNILYFLDNTIIKHE